MHKLPDLAYDFSALEPSIDARTMEIHHGKHHAGYVNNLNGALDQAGPELQDASLEGLMQNLNAVPEEIRTAIRNNGGGHYNHTLFWRVMAQGGAGNPSTALNNAINNAFGSFDNLQNAFSKAAMTRFGSGWAWLVSNNGVVSVTSTPNQDNPLMTGQGTPILGLDVWEHAYYLNYQNRRADYIKAWWDIVNWDEVNKRFENA